MLVSLSIRDVVLIDRLDFEWSDGLSVLTGETGAGKSILLDALGLVTGARGDARLVRTGCLQASVTAIFRYSSHHTICDILSDNGLDSGGDEIVLRRVQSVDGRSRAFCNDTPISIGLLTQIGSHLVEIHGQNDTQLLRDIGRQRDLLDMFGDLEGDVKILGDLYDEMVRLRDCLSAQRGSRDETDKEIDYLSHCIDELDGLAPVLGEEQDLVDERQLYVDAEKLSAPLQEISDILRGDSRPDRVFQSALRRLERVAPSSGGHFDDVIAALDRVVIEISEAGNVVDDMLGQIRHDPSRLSVIDDRLSALRDIARKHRVGCDDLPVLLVDMRDRLGVLQASLADEGDLEQQLAAVRDSYEQQAIALSSARHAAALALDKAVNSELEPLKLADGCFRTVIDTVAIDDGHRHGIDNIMFEAATNAGQAAGAIAKIASGGELARFMLALKLSLSGDDDGATLIFDEVDTGVGGAVADAVGVRLHHLARKGQVLVVTHSPQLAARGDYHWHVRKTSRDGDTRTDVVLLDAATRIEELARMVSGSDITDEARAAAQRLLEGCDA